MYGFSHAYVSVAFIFYKGRNILKKLILLRGSPKPSFVLLLWRNILKLLTLVRALQLPGRPLGLAAALVLLLAIFSGCAGSGDSGNGENRGNSNFQVVLEDDSGRQVRLAKKPQKIISLAPGNTEILFALGLEARIVGVTEYCNYPPAALKKPKAGSFSEPNIEQIVALQPELVAAVSLQEAELVRLEELGIPVIILNHASLEDVYRSMELLGLATGTEENALLLVQETKARIAAVKEKLAKIPENARVKVYYEVSADPLMSVGAASFIHELIQAAGGKNIFADVGHDYPKVNAEAVVSRNPDVMLFPLYHGSEGIRLEDIVGRPGWGTITAIEKGHISDIDADKISRPGPRVAEMIEELAAIFYPDL